MRNQIKNREKKNASPRGAMNPAVFRFSVLSCLVVSALLACHLFDFIFNGRPSVSLLLFFFCLVAYLSERRRKDHVVAQLFSTHIHRAEHERRHGDPITRSHAASRELEERSGRSGRKADFFLLGARATTAASRERKKTRKRNLKMVSNRSPGRVGRSDLWVLGGIAPRSYRSFLAKQWEI